MGIKVLICDLSESRKVHFEENILKYSCGEYFLFECNLLANVPNTNFQTLTLLGIDANSGSGRIE